MENTVFGPEQTLEIWIVLFGIISFAMWAETQTWGKKLGAVVIAIITGFVLGNIGFLPTTAPIYETIWTIVVPLAIPLLLFSANFKKIINESGPTLLAFGIGAVATVVGALAAFYIIALPEQAENLTGVFAATFIGGGMNFAAVSQALGISQDTLLLAAAAADNIVTLLFLFFLAMIPAMAFFTKKYPGERELKNADPAPKAQKSRALDYSQLVLALFISLLLVGLGNALQIVSGWQGTAILFTTLLALGLANGAPVLMKTLENSFDLGMVLMLIFFATLGASANVFALIDTAPILFVFAIIVVVFHFVILFGLGKVMKLTLPELITASNACILGPATAAGLAASNGWKSLVTPGILVGTLGYAIANFIGVALANFLG